MCHECRKTVEEEEKRTEVPMSALMVRVLADFLKIDILLENIFLLCKWKLMKDVYL